ncbi:M14 family metallopeptidase [Alteromonas sp. ASW11-36]|uniref:M14 family metallopeptidase n=1 Tax=Alteromonas arenosi TaxID=3055817 RepID=A0ABT7T0V1_9ALTE|nr:M14 metallopeptidase family protein [Alteromonas sp. ASW11-36]MDM7862053.1 M14 family metallopeptidase [Alteromonas sp. ASW11-36]
MKSLQTLRNCCAYSLCALAQITLFTTLALHSVAAQAGKPVHEYLPQGIEYNSDVPVPSSVLGAHVGEWHVRPDQLVAYMYAIAEASPRVTVVEYARSHENRPLLLLQITSPDNHARLDELQKTHMETLLAGEKPAQDAPLVMYMGYSVHGNEPSGANAALVIAYYLAAANSTAVDTLLNNNIVLLDPVLNPDGLARFAHWANMHRGQTLTADRDHREHQEGWPSGRTNHYWFDLNRDWLLLTHPESRGRIAQYQAWRPHVLTDFHEMGTDSTYFFQPGVPSRKNPLTPQSNVTLTGALAEFHAAALDAQGELYFTEESFDDFYFGKGSTYPDAHGSIGILFEQASSRGHLQESINGELAFEQTIQNQVTTSLSTFAGALANKQALLAYQQQFYKETQDLYKDDKTTGYLIAASADNTRMRKVAEFLSAHKINFQYLRDDFSVAQQRFASGSIFVPTDQAQYRLLKSLFSTRTSFADNTFYDVSTWNLPYAFDLNFAGIERSERRRLKLTEEEPAFSPQPSLTDAYAYAFEWHDYQSPALLTQLLRKGIDVRVAGAGFTAQTTVGMHIFKPGSVVVPMGLEQPDGARQMLTELATEYQIQVHNITSGLTPSGIDLGSRQLRKLEMPRVAIVGGLGTSENEVGEIWHFLDTRLHMPASIIEAQRLERVDLSQYTHLIFANGNYANMSGLLASNIDKWLNAGGVLIGQKAGVDLLIERNWLNAELMPATEVDKLFATKGLQYSDREALLARKRIAGTVFMTQADLTHPLAFGLDDTQMPMFKNSSRVVRQPQEPFLVPFSYVEAPLAAGYADLKMADLVAETPAVIAHSFGQGQVIGFVDDMNFRGYWYGTSKLFANAIYMSSLIQTR